MTELEDIYLPYKPKRRTKAEMAREKGLEPLAKLLMRQVDNNVENTASAYVKGEVKDADDALKGARDIIAEWVNENEAARHAGMSIGVVLVCVELIMMLIILMLMPRALAGACFIGFAIGESLGASALRIAGGIFTKIADIGSDLMKVVFKIGEDDPRNPGVIADCTGDNAGDSVGPTADGFETYGVTGVALVSFIVLAVGSLSGDKFLANPEWQATFLTCRCPTSLR